MKNNILKSLAIILWQVISFTSLYANEATNTITFNIDHSERVTVTLLGTNEIIDLTNPVFQWPSGVSFMMEPSSDIFKITSVKINGETKMPGGDGKYRWGVNGDLNIEITTSENISTLIFDVTDPSHLLVTDNNANVLDIKSPVKIQTGALITIESFSEHYMIERLNAGGRDLYPSGDGRYRFVASNDMHISIKSKSLHPIVTFNIDHPSRVNVINILTDEIIETSNIKVPIPANTPIVIETTDPKHTIQSVEINGTPIYMSGDGKYRTGITADTHIAIKTKSTTPMVTFNIDEPDRVVIWNDGVKIDPSLAYEVEKGSQLIIEASGNEYRIASVLVNNTPIKGASDGKYYTTAMSDIAITVRTKGILPTISLNIDHPERIKITNLTTQEDIFVSDIIELAKGTEISIEALKSNFSILTLKNNGTLINPEDNGKYQFTVNEDLSLNITTSALLSLTIEESTGGKLTISRNGTTLQSGDNVSPGDILDISYSLTDGYGLDFISVNNDKVSEKYTVYGSDDLTVKGTFKLLAEDQAIVQVKIDIPYLVYVWHNGIIGEANKPFEAKKGDIIRITPFGSAEILSVTANDLKLDPDTDGGYMTVVQKNTIISIDALKRIYVTGGRSYGESGQIGRVFIKYNGEISESFNVRAGETVELIKEYNSETHTFLHYIIGYNKDQIHYDDQYTITQEDIDTDRSLSFTGVFDIAASAGQNMISKSRYNEASQEIITSGGGIKIFSISGECILSSNESIISVNMLKNGIYIVKTADSIFKIIKK